MATSDPVEVVVEIIDGFSDELAELKGELESIDLTQINIDVDLDDDAEFERVKAKMEALREVIETKHNINTDDSGFAKAMAQKEALRGDLETKVDFVSEKGRAALAEMGGPEGIGREIKADLPGDLGGMQRVGQQSFPTLNNLDMPDLAPRSERRGRVVGPLMQQAAQMRRNIASARGSATRFDLPGAGRRSRRGLQNLRKTLSRITPNIMDVWNALAALIPVFVTLAGAVIGLVGAMTALGAAGAAVIGLGMLGWGEDLSSSIENARQEVALLKERLFEVVQPAAAEFQPIFEDFLEGAPGQAQDLVMPMRRLSELQDTLASAGAGFVDWLAIVLTRIANMDDQIDTIISSFGRAFGSFLIRVVSDFTAFVAQNNQEIISLSGSLARLFGILFDVSVAVAFTLSKLSPFIDAIAAVADLLRNDIVVHLLSAIGLLVGLESVISIATIAIAELNALLYGTGTAVTGSLLPNLAKMHSWLVTVIADLTALNAQMAVTQALAAGLLGVGAVAAVVGGGALLSQYTGPDTNPRTTGAGSSAPRQVTNINVQGDVGRREMDRLVDRMPGEANREYNTIQQQEGP